MQNRLAIFLAVMSTFTLHAAEWGESTGKLTPGRRVEVQHKGKIDRGLYALSNSTEIVISSSGNTQLAIPQAEVDRVIALGTESPALGYFANGRDQLFPKPEVVYERNGAPAAAKRESHWWSKR